MTLLQENPSVITQTLPDQESASGKVTHKFRHTPPPKLADERDGLNDRIASFIAQTVGSMWMFYLSIIAFTIWMASLGTTVAGDHSPFNLMLLAVGGIMQWLAMIAILVAQNAQGSVQDKQVEHPRPGYDHPPSGRREYRADKSNPRPSHCSQHWKSARSIETSSSAPTRWTHSSSPAATRAYRRESLTPTELEVARHAAGRLGAESVPWM